MYALAVFSHWLYMCDQITFPGMRILKFLALALCASSAMLYPARSAVVLNEVMANNRSAVRNSGQYPDWVEIYNPGPSAANLSGMTLTDNLSSPAKFVFPPSTSLGVGEYLIVWCDSQSVPGEFHTGFSFSSTGEEVGLFTSTGVKVDSVQFGIQAEDFTIGRVPNGTGAWTLTVPTPAGLNVVQPLGSQSTLVLNEWMASPASGEDWLELYNPDRLPVTLSGCVASDKTTTPSTNRPIAALSFIGPESFIQFFASGLAKTDNDHFDFKLGAKGETISFYGADRRTLLNRIKFDTQTSGVSQGRIPDGASTLTFFPAGKATPGSSNLLPIDSVVINEVITHTDFPLEDAVELHNVTSDVVDISYWWMSNDKTDPKKYQFPANTRIPAQGYLVIYEFQFDPDDTGNGRSFRFNSSKGDECHIFTADPTGALTGGQMSVKLLPAENAVSFGRFQTSQGFEFVPMSQRTFGMDTPNSFEAFRTGKGLPNAYPKIGPMVISEIMYHPSGANAATDNTLDEYVEFRNLTGSTLPLYNTLTDFSNISNSWRLNGTIEFEFPRRSTCPPNGAILLVGFDPSQTDLLAAFRNRFGVPEETPVFGPFRGKLSNSGGSINLFKPDEIQRFPHPDAGLIPMLLVEQIQYGDQSPWPVEADGQGAALHRIGLAEFGNDPVNWRAGTPTPGLGMPPTPPVRFTAFWREVQSITMQFQAQKGVSYRWEFSESLTGANPVWLPIQTIPAGIADRTETLMDNIPAHAGKRYYRLVAPAE